MISVSRTKLPELSEYNKYLKRIWKSNWLTNNGELVQELEKKLQDYFKVKYVVCVSSGTAATLVALKALDIKKEIYVSPYSYVSTVSAPLFLGIQPKFVDLDEEWKAPALITHIYGISRIENVKPVIYDASHAFTTQYKGKSILNYGDLSIISFNAVKIFQTVEGGAVVTNNKNLAEKARLIRNFGWKKQYVIDGVGVNFKMSEFHAAMGLCALPMVKKIRKRFDQIIERYNKGLNRLHQGVTYYPIFYQSEKKLLKAINCFEKQDIFPRRYFYPPLNKVFGGKSCPMAEDLMSKVLCLPLYYDLKDEEIDLIIKITKETL